MTAITIQGIYACICVSDFSRGVDFYTRFAGRDPDDRPMDNLVQWRDGKSAGLQIWHDPENAGHSRTTIVVPVMATERERLAAAGIILGEDVIGDWGIIAQLTDPDGNMITLAEPPKGYAG